MTDRPAVDGLPVLVAGLGISGAAAARVLLAAGAEVLAVDSGAPAALEGRAEELEGLGADVRIGLGQLTAALLDGRALVIPSPGLAASDPLLTAATRRGLPVWSEPELAWRLAAREPRLVAVTGTNGKTSTTELLAACVGAPAAGNIGTPLSDVLAGPSPPDLVVAELSSFQLHFCHTLRPEVAVLLNVAPDHLDWHGSVEAYRSDKAKIWQVQHPGDWAVVNADDEGAQGCAGEHPPPGQVARFTLGPPGPGEVGVEADRIVSRLPGSAGGEVLTLEQSETPGQHHVANVVAAVTAALCAGVAPEQLGEPVRRYRPGPHRLELTAAVDGVTWVNDSKATNPHAAAAALTSFPSVVWIAGGLAKGLAFEVLAPLLAERVRVAVTIGEAGPQIAELTRSLGITTVEAGDLDRAVRSAADLAQAGDTVLLAPACASMDQFADYAERGNAFRAAVHALQEAREGAGHGH